MHILEATYVLVHACAERVTQWTHSSKSISCGPVSHYKLYARVLRST